MRLLRTLLALAAGFGVVAVVGAGSSSPARSTVTEASLVNVSISAAACRAVPARVPNGAVRFTIRNRSGVAQRFRVAGATSTQVRAGRIINVQAILDEPGLRTYTCTPSRGTTRRGSLLVARNVLIETDMDASAAMSILYLLSRRDVEVAAIVVDGDGEARCPTGATNALSLTTLAGKPTVPVGCGRSMPLRGTHAFPTAFRDFTDRFFGLPPPAAPGRAPNGTGEQVYRTAIEAAPGRVDVVVDGPSTELAALLSSDGALRQRIRSVTMMGGAIRVPGNMTWPPEIANRYAEWNFYVDPFAANVVLSSGIAITLVPLDATNHVPLSTRVVARLGSSPSGMYVRRLIESIAPPGGADSDRFYFWDPLAASVLVEPAISSYAHMRLTVVEGEGPESGRAVPSSDGATVRVAMFADRARFETSFVTTLR